MQTSSSTARIHSFQSLGTVDGPGVRAVVFMQGCPLRCACCHNPDTWAPDGGSEVTVDALLARIERCRGYFGKNGGVTVSGGEPLMQAEFVCELAKQLAGIHLAIQTSGHAHPEIYRRVISHFDYIMQDIKLADPTAHKHFTGVDNKWILENVAWLKQSGKTFVLRVPLIPGITDTEENLRAISVIAGDAPVELLRYNPLAGAKYATFGMSYPLSDRTNRDEDFTGYFANATMS